MTRIFAYYELVKQETIEIEPMRYAFLKAKTLNEKNQNLTKKQETRLEYLLREVEGERATFDQ